MGVGGGEGEQWQLLLATKHTCGLWQWGMYLDTLTQPAAMAPNPPQESPYREDPVEGRRVSSETTGPRTKKSVEPVLGPRECTSRSRRCNSWKGGTSRTGGGTTVKVEVEGCWHRKCNSRDMWARVEAVQESRPWVHSEKGWLEVAPNIRGFDPARSVEHAMAWWTDKTTRE